MKTKIFDLSFSGRAKIPVKVFFTFLSFLLLIFLYSHTRAQSGLCDPGVPFEVVDLTADPAGEWHSIAFSRSNHCCGVSNPQRCLEFEITLHPDAIAINFEITSGAIPPGSLFYQINCGSPVQVGEPICLTGPGPHILTFCKPGNNVNTYAVTSIPEPSITDPNFATENCPSQISISGMISGSITIEDLSGGGAYLDYLSCTDCEDPIITPSGAFPAYVDYLICGEPKGSVCLTGTNFCDTIRVYFYDTIVTAVNPNPASYCEGEAGVWLYSDVNAGVPPYNFEWYDAADGSGNLLGTDEDYFATNPGTYSLIVYDSLYPQCGPFIVNVEVLEHPNPVLVFDPVSPYFCEGGSVDVTVTGANDYSWSPPDGLSQTTGSIVTASHHETITYTIIGTDNNGCTSTADITVEVCDAPDIDITTVDQDICVGDSVQLEAQGAMFYSWYPSEGLSDPDIANPTASPNATTTYHAIGYDVSCNVIANGDFSQGNTGFTTEYNYDPNLYPEGNYYIGTNPNDYHANFSPCSDQSGDGNMMILNGDPSPNQEVWCQTIAVNSNTDYVFSTWLTSVHPANPAVLQFSVNGVLLGNPFPATATTCEWNQFYEVWNSGTNTVIEICIVNQNTIANGNDFAIDGIFFSPLCSATDSVIITVHNPENITFSNTGPFCETDDPTNMIANPTGGTWSGTGISDPNNGTFSPTSAGTGIHVVNYLFDDGICQTDTTIFITVDALPDATITAIGPFCEDQDIEVSLIAIDGGGTWAGNGVAGDTFNPSVALAGDHIITYEVINGECSDTDQITVHVDQIVDATITAIGPFCENQDISVPLVAVDGGGTWAGPGVVIHLLQQPVTI